MIFSDFENNLFRIHNLTFYIFYIEQPILIILCHELQLILFTLVLQNTSTRL